MTSVGRHEARTHHCAAVRGAPQQNVSIRPICLHAHDSSLPIDGGIAGDPRSESVDAFRVPRRDRQRENEIVVRAAPSVVGVMLGVRIDLHAIGLEFGLKRAGEIQRARDDESLGLD